MIITKNRTGFARKCFVEGVNLRPRIAEMESGDIFDIFTVGGLNTWKSLAADAMICGMADGWHLDMLRDEMMYESNKTSASGDENAVQDAQDKSLFKFFQVNGSTVCVAFSSSQEFFESHVFEEKTMKQQVQDTYGLKDTDIDKLIIFQSLHDLEWYDGDRKKCPAKRVIEVTCPDGLKSDVRHLTFS